jgi:hypothetical protein
MMHEPGEPGGEGGLHQRFEYFMVRITRSAGEPDRVAGLIERLGSGEKRSFDTGDQLVRLVGGGFDPELNLQSIEGGRNAVSPDADRSLNNHGR